jgi:hypothetical protein
MTRIPTHRPPTHPGEMLREEFRYHAMHAPGAEAIRKIRLLRQLAHAGAGGKP